MSEQEERRARVQRDGFGRSSRWDGKPGTTEGTVSWAEHEAAWREYARCYGSDQSADRINERSGFSYGELCRFLGRAPETWKPARP